ncbi:hypothetical protein OROHE_018943 [Orobanche hederae]
MASVDAANPLAPPQPRSPIHARSGVRLDDLKRIDIGQLSQSELQALSSCSSCAFDVRRTDDDVSPQLDRSVFNESAASRRQTYSRLHYRSHSRLPGPHHSLKPYRHPQPSPDPVSHSIIHFLKHFLNGNYCPPPPAPLPQEPLEAVPAPIGDLGFLELQEKMKITRKRVRRRKNMSTKKFLENGVGIELVGVNGKGVVVDFAELEKEGDELFSEELKRRTVGLETEEHILGFLSGLEGQWCSRRKKRKYVDAGLLGDALPIGWNILLGLRRRDYHVSVYCRRYISNPRGPTGQQFMSCKEVASYLKSYFGGNDARQRDQKTCSIQQAYVFSFGNNALPADKMDDTAHDKGSHSNPFISASNSHDIDDCLMGIENLPEVQVLDIFECLKCNLTFDEKGLYLQHLFSFHQSTTKRYKFGTSVGEGVIIKDGKYECQFCHKVFDERRSYNGHVGTHVRNSGKNSNELALAVHVQQNYESPSQNAVPSESSKMDALEIAQNSDFGTLTTGSDEQDIIDHTNSILKIEAAPAASSEPIKIQEENHRADKSLTEDLSHDNEIVMENHDMVGNDYAWGVDVEMDSSCINDLKPAGSGEIDKYENSSLDMGYREKSLKPNDGHREDTPELTVGDIVFDDGVPPEPLAQSFELFPPFDSVSDKREHDFSIVHQKFDNVTGFEELRFEDLDPFKYGFENGQDLSSLPGVSMNLGNESGIEDRFNSSIGFGSEEVMMDTVGVNQLTLCVWCRTEFKLEGIESEAPSDSIGYMCPTCKTKISGHFGVGLSMYPNGF